MTTTVVLDDHAAKLLRGLANQHSYLLGRGQQVCKMYPPDRVPPDVFENITVPIPLPTMLMLFGLATSLCAQIVKQEKPIQPEATP